MQRSIVQPGSGTASEGEKEGAASGARAAWQSRAIPAPQHRRPPLGMPTAGLELGGEETSSAAGPPFCRPQERWDSTPQSNLYVSKRKEGVRAECCRGMGSSGASWGDAGTARGRPRLKVRKDTGAAPAARKGIKVQQAWQASQSLRGSDADHRGSAQLSDASCRCGTACFYTQDSVCHLGLPQCPMPVSVSWIMPFITCFSFLSS